MCCFCDCFELFVIVFVVTAAAVVVVYAFVVALTEKNVCKSFSSFKVQLSEVCVCACVCVCVCVVFATVLSYVVVVVVYVLVVAIMGKINVCKCFSSLEVSLSEVCTLFM